MKLLRSKESIIIGQCKDIALVIDKQTTIAIALNLV
jgi:hypothetical protein